MHWVDNMTGDFAHVIEYLQAIDHRLARVESRLVQLMVFVGADPYGKNEPAVVRRRDDPRRNKRNPLQSSS